MKNQVSKILSNIHAHTKWCNHSDIEPEWLIKEAIKQGFKQYTISEHIPYPERVGCRTFWEDYPKVFQILHDLKKKYNSKDFQMFVAVETEYTAKDHDFYVDFYKKSNADFMIFGNHRAGSCFENSLEYYKLKNKDEMLGIYYKQTIEGLNSGLFFHFAHPDLILNYLKTWNDDVEKKLISIVNECIKKDISIGFNVNGLYTKKNKPDYEIMYPCEKFWKIVSKTNAKVRIEVDIHKQEMMNTNITNQAYDLAIEWGLKKNLIDWISSDEIKRVSLFDKKQ